MGKYFCRFFAALFNFRLKYGCKLNSMLLYDVFSMASNYFFSKKQLHCWNYNILHDREYIYWVLSNFSHKPQLKIWVVIWNRKKYANLFVSFSGIILPIIVLNKERWFFWHMGRQFHTTPRLGWCHFCHYVLLMSFMYMSYVLSCIFCCFVWIFCFSVGNKGKSIILGKHNHLV